MKHHIIYIPGLGERFNTFRIASLWCWRLFGVSTQLILVKWHEEKTLDNVCSRVKLAIDEARAKGFVVSLMAESAGASIAINVAAGDENIHRLVTICGVDSSHMNVSETLPLLRESIHRLSASLPGINLKRTHVITALFDSTVARHFSIIPGAQHHRLFTIGHRVTVILCLTLLSGYVISLVKREK